MTVVQSQKHTFVLKEMLISNFKIKINVKRIITK